MTGRAWALFIVVAVLWGVPYLFIGVALQDGVGPLSTAALRVLSAVVVMVPLAFRRRHRSLLTGRWGRLAVVSLVEVVVPFSLIPLGEQTVSSGLAGVLIATEPMFVLAVGLVLGTRARPTLTALLGLGVGFLGVVVLLGVDGSGAGAGLLVIAAAFYGAGAVLVGRWFGDLPATPVVAGMLVLAAPFLLALALVSESLTVPSYAGIAALAALGLVTTPGGLRRVLPTHRAGRTGPRRGDHLRRTGRRRVGGRSRPRGADRCVDARGNHVDPRGRMAGDPCASPGAGRAEPHRRCSRWWNRPGSPARAARPGSRPAGRRSRLTVVEPRVPRCPARGGAPGIAVRGRLRPRDPRLRIGRRRPGPHRRATGCAAAMSNGGDAEDAPLQRDCW